MTEHTANYTYDPKETVVIQHPEFGIYVGQLMGFAFWSKLDPAGQDSAPCFPNEEIARKYVATWDQEYTGMELASITYPKVVPDIDCGLCDQLHYATIHAIAATGLEPWNPSLPEERH